MWPWSVKAELKNIRHRLASIEACQVAIRVQLDRIEKQLDKLLHPDQIVGITPKLDPRKDQPNG